MIADGKLVATGLKQKIKEKINGQQKEVCFIIFGNDPGSRQFISMKCRFAESLGIHTEVLEYPENTTFEEVKEIINTVSSKNINGIVVQLPLPNGFNTEEILNLVPEELDIDVLGNKTKEDYKNGMIDKIPPVSRAVDEILRFYNVDLNNKKILVIGSGKLVGEPVANMFRLNKVPFDVVDKNTDKEKSKKLISEADIIISGAGDSHFIKTNMIKDGVVLIDAGTSEQNGKIVGDVDPECGIKASLITPVPGGVGPVTLASLFLNL